MRARRNPLGRFFPNTMVCLVGKSDVVHIFHPIHRQHICNSGKNAGRIKKNGTDNRGKKKATYYVSNARYVTCIRCMKLGMMNEKEGRAAWDSGS